ncbi:transmembrane protein [Fagus crenata]
MTMDSKRSRTPSARGRPPSPPSPPRISINSRQRNPHRHRQPDRCLRILDSQRSVVVDFDVVSRSKHCINDNDDSSDGEGDRMAKNGKAEESKKVKAKKPKKPKVTVSDAAAKIDVDDLSAFLADITASYQGQQEIQLMRFADYFGRAFSAVSAAQFPWVKMFRESTVAKFADVSDAFVELLLWNCL